MRSRGNLTRSCTTACPTWKRKASRTIAWAPFQPRVSGIAGPTSTSGLGFCLDTGHMDYSGMDPIETLRRYAGRTDYIHFKDIDATKYADVMKRRIRFFDACAEGVMCPIGRGRIDYLGLRDLLNEIGYAGYITIEQERD